MRIREKRGQQKTKCSKCKNNLEDTRIGKQRYCKSCHAEYMRKTRPKHSQLNKIAKEKAVARAYLNVYVKRGTIKKLPCSVCGERNSQAHHDDYSKPLAVVWFCRKHHLELHSSAS